MNDLDLAEMALRLGAAMVLGFLLGVERERKQRPAGMRTMMLVSLGSATFMIGAWEMLVVLPAGGDATSELTRVFQGVVQGIGFLGAGAIIQSRGHVRGMTTAATVWVAAAVGIAAGLGQFALAGMVAALALVTLALLKPVEDAVFRNGEASEDRAGEERRGVAGEER